MEQNQDGGRVDGKSLPMELMAGLPLEPTLVIPQEIMEFLPQEIPLKRMEGTGLVAPWY